MRCTRRGWRRASMASSTTTARVTSSGPPRHFARVLGGGPQGVDPNALFFQALAEDQIVREARLIAEPWDVGPGGYQLGAFGPGFAEWNDRFRDASRRFWRGDRGLRGELATR